MSAVQYRFRPRADLLRQDQNARVSSALSEAVSTFDGSELERRVFAKALSAAQSIVDRQTASQNQKVFFMLLPSQNRLVVEYLSTQSKWPKVATRLWAWLFEFVAPDGEILITREGLIDRVGCSPRAVGGVLGELVACQALTRRREPQPGKQGRGHVRYYMNASVGTQFLKNGERDKAVASASPLRLQYRDGVVQLTDRRARAASPVAVVL